MNPTNTIEEKVKEILQLVPNIACGNKSIDELRNCLLEVQQETIKQIADKEVDCELKGYNNAKLEFDKQLEIVKEEAHTEGFGDGISAGSLEERAHIKEDLMAIADKWEIEDLRVQVEIYFKDLTNNK